MSQKGKDINIPQRGLDVTQALPSEGPEPAGAWELARALPVAGEKPYFKFWDVVNSDKAFPPRKNQNADCLPLRPFLPVTFKESGHR